MPLWTNTVKPIWKFVSNTAARHGYSKRNIVATDTGWVHRVTYTDVHGTKRTHDEVLVSIPRLGGSAKGHAFPSVVDMYTANSSGGSTLKKAMDNKIYLVFNEPLALSNAYGRLRMTVANTAAGNNAVATSNNVAASVSGADNTIAFTFRTATAGTYKVQAQTLANVTTWQTLTGNVTATTGSNNISWSTVGPSTNFTAQVAVGDIVKLGTDTTPIRIHSIANTTRMVGVARVAGNQTNKGYVVKRVHHEYSLNTGAEQANLVITSAVSNALGTFTVV